MDCDFDVRYKNSLPKIPRILFYIFSKSFIVLCFQFKSVIHFELNFVWGESFRLRFFYLFLSFFLCIFFLIVWLMYVLACFSLDLSYMGLSVLPGLDWLFPSHVREVFNYNLFKYILRPFLLLFFSWDPYNSNVGAFNIVPEVSETVLSSFHSFFFILLCGSYFHYFLFQVTYPFFCLSYSAIDSF